MRLALSLRGRVRGHIHRDGGTQSLLFLRGGVEDTQRQRRMQLTDDSDNLWRGFHPRLCAVMSSAPPVLALRAVSPCTQLPAVDVGDLHLHYMGAFDGDTSHAGAQILKSTLFRGFA